MKGRPSALACSGDVGEWKRPNSSSRIESCQHFQVGPHHPLNAIDARIVHQPFQTEIGSFYTAFKPLNGNFQANLVAELEAVGHCFFRVIDSNTDPIHLVRFDSSSK